MLIERSVLSNLLKNLCCGCLLELMSTHSIGFYEEISKIISELSLSTMKYAPYLLYWRGAHWPSG